MKMKMHFLLPALPLALTMCDFGPAPLNLGEAPRTNAQGELTIPLNVSKAFSPTGYFYNVWAPADSTFTKVDPEKWNNFLAYQSVFQHPACADRVSMGELVRQDSTLPAFIPPSRFHDEFTCTQFTYAPLSEDDLYGGVFWLRNNNFGNYPGVKVDAGAKVVRFWARTLSGRQAAKFGVGVNNNSTLKPWAYFSPYVDTWGDPTPEMVERFRTQRIPNSQGVPVDSLVADSVISGMGYSAVMNLTDQWTLYEMNLGILYGFNTRKDTVRVGDSIIVNEVPFDSIPEHRMIGAFFWALESAFIADSSRVTEPLVLPDGSRRQARFGAATILIDGIRYE